MNSYPRLIAEIKSLFQSGGVRILDLRIEGRVLYQLAENKSAYPTNLAWFCVKGGINDTSFFSKLLNGPNKQECFTTQGSKDLPETSTAHYWAHS